MTDATMTIDLPIEDTFDCPAGFFAAKLDEVKLKPEWDGEELINKVRLLFEVTVPKGKPHKRYLVGRTFHPNSRPLRQFLEGWLGDNLMDGAKDGVLDLRQHIAKPAELVITHHTNKSYKKPFVCVEEIHAPGTLRLTDGFKDKANNI